MGQNDYAILVGISRYADPSLPKLEGPIRDVELMKDWLTSKQGGDVANVFTIVSDVNAAVPTQGEMPPTVEDFRDTFLQIVRKPDKSLIRRPGARLYLYFSGHGFCQKAVGDAHAALYAAGADAYFTPNISGTHYARWVKEYGLFDEIVLIMDCCRDAELAKHPEIPPLRWATDVGTGRDVRLFQLYAAPRGGKAQERAIPSRKNEVYGLVTHAFRLALDHAAPEKPVVETHAIKSFLEEYWPEVCGTQPADPPEVIIPPNGEIAFRRPGALDFQHRFNIAKLTTGRFRIVDGNLDTVASVITGPHEAVINWTAKPATTVPVTDGFVTIPLPAGYYMAVGENAAGPLTVKFQSGGPDVTF